MVSSIYHFFLDLVSKRGYFLQEHDLESFDYDKRLIASFSKGSFPDVILKTNENDPHFSGGEFIEFKNTKKYSISSFNSTIPTGTKPFGALSLKRRKQLCHNGYGSDDDEPRTVYYLIRGRIPDAKPFPVSKVCLVHGSFFETVSVPELVKKAFQQILSDFSTVNLDKSEFIRQPKQEDFARTRRVESSSVKIRFRVMTEVESKANLLLQSFAPVVKDNTLSLFVPLHCDDGTQPLNDLVPPNQLDSNLPPLVLLREAWTTDQIQQVWDDILVGTIRHPIDNSLWFIAQSSFNLDQAVHR